MPNPRTIAFPNYIPTKTTQADFSGGLGAVGAPHLIAPNEVAASTNIDYSLEWGGAPARRGNITYAWETGHGVNAINIQLIGRNYAVNTGVWVDGSIPWFAAADSGVTYTGSGTVGASPVSLASVTGYAGGSQGQVFPVFTSYQNYVYVANGTSAFRTNGTNTFDWIIPQADQPTVTMAQEALLNGGILACFTGTFTATEGTVTGSSTSTFFPDDVYLMTCTTGTGSRIVVIGTVSGTNAIGGFGTSTNWDSQVKFIIPPTGTAITSLAGTYTIGGAITFHQGWPGGDTSGGSGTYTATATVTETLNIGLYGSDYMLMGLPNQQNIVSISRDLAIGDTTFTNYWHFETTPTAIQDANTDPTSLLLAAQGTFGIDSQRTAMNFSRAAIVNPSRGNSVKGNSPIGRTVNKVTTNVTATPWAVARSDYQFIGTIPNPDFTNIQAVRVTIEYNTTGQSALLGGLITYGGQAWCLNDEVVGLSYYQTFARVENNVIVAEGAASLPSAPQKVQYAIGEITCPAVTNTSAGITHRVFYRSGGLLQDSYRVGSCTILSGTATIYDYNNPDLRIISNPSMKRFLWGTWPSPSAGTGLPGVNCVSQAWNDRIFLGVQANLYWTYPGQPTQINDDSQTIVGDTGDSIQGLIPYTNMVIVKQASVWELAGSIFEGTNQDWTLQKSGSRRGSAAPKTVIQTPYGVLLFSYDGISMYEQGYGIDRDLSWVYDKIGDLWKGTAATDPAGLKGRIPALNQTAIFNSCAAYMDEKVYLAVPTGTNTLPDTVFVLDVPRQKTWMFQYPFKINSLYWDRVNNRLMAGTDKGTIQELETGLVDDSTTNTASGISWSFTTRQWTTPTDLIYENLQIENVGTMTVSATVDNVALALNTFSNTAKTWTPCSIKGTIGDNFSFVVNGTMSGTRQEVFQTEWDMIPQAQKVTAFTTDFTDVPAENYVKTWLAELDILSTALSTKTVTATLLVNGTPLTLINGGTSTAIVGSPGAGRKIYELSLPNVTTAKTVQAIYNSSNSFRYFDTQYELETKPFEKYTWLVTYKKIGGATQADMLRFYAMDIEGTLTATVTATWIIDGTAFTTNTFTISTPNAGEESGVGRMYADQVPMPPGARGYLFQQQLTSAQPFRVWKAHVDVDRIGVKGLSRISLSGTPSPQEGRQ